MSPDCFLTLRSLTHSLTHSLTQVDGGNTCKEEEKKQKKKRGWETSVRGTFLTLRAH